MKKFLSAVCLAAMAASIVACSFLGFGGMVDGIFGL